MMTKLNITALPLIAGLATALSVTASAQTADPATVDAYVKATFGKAPAAWQARIEPDETLKLCNQARNAVPWDEADKITARELAKVVYPPDGKFLGDWKRGAEIANNGRGGQFSDEEGSVAGGNCYACHQMEKQELSYGTLGPSLTGYGRERNYASDAVKKAFTKIYDSQAAVACSNMPRFGANKVLTEQQIIDLVAFLFDPKSPVNK
jgi:L-cysteine S-thiosulfotransferase